MKSVPILLLLSGLLCSPLPAQAGDPITDVTSLIDGYETAFVQRSDVYGDLSLRFNNVLLTDKDSQTRFRNVLAKAQARSHIHELHMLHYGDDGIAQGGMVFLKELPELRLISLGGARYSAADLDFLGECPKLDRVYLSGVLSPRALQGLGTAKNVTLLRMQHAKTDWSKFPALTKLILLDAEKSDLSDEGAAALQGCTSLQVLYAYDAPLTDAGLLALAKIKSLQFVGVESPRITAEGIAAFKKLRNDVELVTKKPRPVPRARPRRGIGGELAAR